VIWRFGVNLESSGFQRTPKCVKDTILTVALLFAQLFGASSDSLKHFSHLALLLGRDILKCTFDESGDLAEDRNEYSASLLRKRNNAILPLCLFLGYCLEPPDVLMPFRTTVASEDPQQLHRRFNVLFRAY
jgi:hypothetical protein